MSDAEAGAIRSDVRYYRVHLRSALDQMTSEVRSLIDVILLDAECGRITPLPVTTYALDQAAAAFRYMASCEHIGRVLLLPEGAVVTEGVENQRGFPGFRANGAYVVTGGCAGLGLLTVEWLGRQKAGCVLALSRTGPDEETRAKFEQLERSGTRVVWARCDVGRSDELARALERIPAGFTLRGVFHAAGVLEDGGLQQQSMERFRPVLNAKIAGAWNLHRLTAKLPLDCFVLYSSAAGVLGARGQASYAAANAYLDALAKYRRSMGMTALSVAWGAWSGSGAAVRHGAVQRIERAGAAPIAPALGFELLHNLMEQDVTHVLAASVDWRRWKFQAKSEATANADLLLHVLGKNDDVNREETQAAAVEAAAVGWNDQLSACHGSHRFNLLQSLLEDRTRAVLSMPAGEPLESARPLQEYGLDSLLSIELVGRLSAEAGQRLPATTLFDYPTLAALTQWLLSDVFKMSDKDGDTAIQPVHDASPGADGAERGSGHAAGYSGGNTLLDGIAGLSEEEIERIFQQKMAGISS